MLFPIPMWGFERIHPAGMSVEFVRRVLTAIPNVVAIKAEQGFPHVAGVIETWHHFGKEVIISCPIEADAIPLSRLIPLQFSGTSNTQWMSDYYPKTFNLARVGRFEEAMELFWKVAPARAAGSAVQAASAPGTSVLNRTAWKYQDWLAGLNGGPLRAPSTRIPDRFMIQLRKALKDSGLPVTSDPDKEFIVGRFPC
jgi:4-hydroxy-tetrahydrodipicolinate synthase